VFLYQKGFLDKKRKMKTTHKVLIGLFILAAAADVWTTWRHTQFVGMQGEINPFVKSILGGIVLKLAITIPIIYIFWKSYMKASFRYQWLINGTIVLGILLQGLAAGSNYYQTEKNFAPVVSGEAQIQENPTGGVDVIFPDEPSKSYTLKEYSNGAWIYLGIVSLVYFYPLLFGFLIIKLTEWVNNEGKSNEQLVRSSIKIQGPQNVV